MMILAWILATIIAIISLAGWRQSERLLKLTKDQRDRLNRENETLHNTLLKAMTIIEELQRAGIPGEEQQV